MAKSNSVSGSSVYVAEGQDPPVDIPDGVRLVGPGASVEPEPVDPEPDPESSPEAEVEPPPGVDEPAAAEPPRRPVVADPKADWVAWAVACGLDRAEAEAMTKAELQALP